MRRKSRHLLRVYEATMASLFVILTLVLPKMSVVFVEFIPGVQSAVICTGAEYVTLILGPDGAPVDVTEFEDNDCHRAIPTVRQTEVSPYWQRLALTHSDPFIRKIYLGSHSDQIASLEPSRAPPPAA